MAKALHVAIGHYTIGYKDGVNTVIARTALGLQKVAPNLRITVFGKASPEIETFLPWEPGKLEYLDIEELDTSYSSPAFEGRNVNELEAHDYIWLGTNIARKLLKGLNDADAVIMENPALGINPAVTYAFYLMANISLDDHPKRKYFLRVHDFAQQRPDFFRNLKKFQHDHYSTIPHWHNLVYPSLENVEYLVINSSDRDRLFEHGIEESRVHYIPNFVEENLLFEDEHTAELREKIIKREGLDPEINTGFILYPVRSIWRKNIEEAIFITQLINRMANLTQYNSYIPFRSHYHLLVSLGPGGAADQKYTSIIQRYIDRHNWPVTIGMDDLVSLKREHNSEGEITKYSVADLFRAASMIVTTSKLEGFGMAFIEPWLADKPVMGRNLPLVTTDFCKAGIQLEHLYNVLLIEGRGSTTIGSALPPELGLEERLVEILRLKEDDYLDNIIAHNASSIGGTLRLFDPKNQAGVVKANKRIVLKNYCQKRTCKLIYQLIKRKR